MKLGSTDIQISPIALGTWAMGGGDSWGESDPALAIKAVHRALELGVNFIDTAPAYGNGLSEQLLGTALQGKRNQAVLATKCGLVWGGDDEGSVHKSRDGVIIRRNLSRKSILKQVEESLGRLKTDYIDLLLTHWQSIPPMHTPIEETIETFELLKLQGKIRSYGACNVSFEELKAYQKYGTPSLVQERFSLLSREKTDLAGYCAEQQITFQAYSPLERGVLTGPKALDNQVAGTAKASVVWYNAENRTKVLTLLTSLQTLAQSYHTCVGNLVIAWTRQATGTMNVLCGARKPSQIEENSKAQDLVITAKDWAFIDSLARTLL